MSYDPNQSNQQWQQFTDPSQQQLQPFNQQGTQNPPIPGGGNYQKSQQSYSWTDGNTQGQHHQSHQSWSWQGTTTSPVSQTPSAFQPPLLLPMSPMQNSHQQLHQQMIQNAANHAQQAIAHHQQVMQQNMSTFVGGMTPMPQQTPVQPQITYQTARSQQQSIIPQNIQQPPQQQAQIECQPMSPMATGPQMSYQVGWQQQQQQQQPLPQAQQNIYQQSNWQGSTMLQLPPAQGQPAPPGQSQSPALSQLQLPPTEQSPQHDHRLEEASHRETQYQRFRDLEKQRKDDTEKMNRAGVGISNRLRGLEQSNVQSRQDNDAKDREVRRLQEKLAAVERQRRADAERNNQQLAELVRSQATSSPAATPAFDMSALQKVIRETQAQQLSAQDIERVIEEQVNKRLTGMATKADIQSAGVQMQNAMSRVPAGLSQEQVQEAVNRELHNVMQDVANRVNQQRRVAAQGQIDAQPRSAPQNRVQTDFAIEELPDDAVSTQPKSQPHRERRGHRSQRALPPVDSHDSASGAGQLTTRQKPLPTTPAAVSGPSGRLTGPSTQGGAPRKTQYAALEAPPRESPLSSIPKTNSVNKNVNSAGASRQMAALEAPPVPSSGQEGALALVDKRTSGPAMPSNNSKTMQPRGSSSHQQSVPQNQARLQAAPHPPTHGQGSQQHAIRQSRQIDAGPAQRQLEAPPVSSQVTTARGQQPNSQAPEAASTQRQLEAPPAPSGSGTSQDLVIQGRDVARRAPGR